MPNNPPPINTTPETVPTSTTSSSSNLPSTPAEHTCGKDCDQCLKGGMPVKREMLSFVVILLVGLVTLLFVLFINEKRKTIVYAPITEETVMTTTSMKYEMPAMKTITSYIDLPAASTQGQHTFDAVVSTRRSRRAYAETPVELADLSQILWSAQGITDPEHGYRTAPSARSAYPFTVYAVVRNVAGIDPGFYEYLPEKNQLGSLGIANAGELLTSAGVQEGAQQSPVVLLLAGAPAKMLAKAPDNDPMPNLYLEAGHIGQNIYLQIEDLGMSTVVMGGFDSAAVGEALQLDPNEMVIYVVPLGNRATEEPVATH